MAYCRTSDPPAAVDDLVAASQIGRNASPTLIAHLVDLAIHGLVIDSIAEHASTLAGDDGARLVKTFESAHYEEGLYRAIEEEADMYDRTADAMATMPREELMRLAAAMTDNRSTVEPIEPEQVIADIRQVAKLYREYPKASQLPEAEYRAWLTPVAAVLNESPFGFDLQNYVDRAQAMTIRDAMAVAGLAVIRDGPDALQSHPDPATGQPFAYTQTADGFELQSNSSFQLREKSIKLSFK